MADEKEKTVDIFTVTEVPVTLTYDGLGAPPITFYLRPCLNREEQDLRQALLALSDEDRQAGIHTHNIEMIARLSTRDPEGITDFPDDAVPHPGDQIRRFFADGSPMKRKVLNDALSRYYVVTQPSEFFRSV